MRHTQTFPIRPKPKERPRPRPQLGGRRRVYTPQATIDFENQIRETYDGPFFTGPVYVALVFDTDEIRLTIEDVDLTRPKHVRADIDNLVKSVMDGLQTDKRTGEPGAFLDDKNALAIFGRVAEVDV